MKQRQWSMKPASCATVVRALPLWVLGAALLSSCAARDVRSLGDGAYSVDCSGGYHDWSACHAAARRVCRGGSVEILSQVSNEGSQGVGTRDWSTEGSEVSRRMTFRCR